MKKDNGITLISLVIVIVIIFIITGTTIYTSVDRFKINNLSKLKNDLELLSEKVSSYYIKYGGIPILRDSNNNGVVYTFTQLNFEKNPNDDEHYYIIDLDAIGNITLNYGKEGFENPNASDDVYIINNKTHEIYYVRGVESKNGKVYHSVSIDNNVVNDNIPPTKPEIKIISQNENEEGVYTSAISIEILQGKDNTSGIAKTTYVINEGEEIDISTLSNNILKLEESGRYVIKARSYDENGNVSDYNTKNITIMSIEKGVCIEYNVEYTDMYIAKDYTSQNGWRLLDYKENGDGTYSNVKIMSTGIPAKLYYYNSDTTNNSWYEKDETKLNNFREILGGDEYGFFTGTYEYIGLKASAGLYYNFANLRFAYATEQRGQNLGYFNSIVNNETTYNSSTTTEVSGRDLFLTNRTDTTVRLSTLTEMNKFLNRTDIDSKTTIEATEDSKGMYRLSQLIDVSNMSGYVYNSSASYLLASPTPNPGTYMTSASYLTNISASSGNMGGAIYLDTGVRPVICFSNDVQFVDEDLDGIMEIK